jgi:hypothetical protein
VRPGLDARTEPVRVAELGEHCPSRFVEGQRKGWASLSDRDAVAAAIDILVSTHHCREVPHVFQETGGRPSVSYCWNPTLKVEG